MMIAAAMMPVAADERCGCTKPYKGHFRAALCFDDQLI